MLAELLQSYPYFLLPSLMSNFNLIPLFPPDKSDEVYEKYDPTFDYIIIGAGSAGSTLAYRLCEIPQTTVLLIEAGGNPIPLESDLFALQVEQYGTEVDWAYLTEPANESCHGYVNNQLRIPRGKMLGGTSSINENLYNRCSPTDYDGWAAMGNPGWSYEDVLPYFKKLERVRVSRWPVSDKHGYKGPIDVQDFTNRTLVNLPEIAKFYSGNAAELGLPKILDQSVDRRAGITIVPGTIRDQLRWSTARGYLQPLRNTKCLTLMKKTLATKVLFDGNKKAIGVEVLKNGIYKKIYTKKEVIVSGGAINSPQILLLSGIGPADHLKDMGIPIVTDLKVGFNLHDQPATFSFRAKVDFSNYEVPHTPTLLEYLFLVLTDRIDDSFSSNILLLFNTSGYPAHDPNIQCEHFIAPKDFSGKWYFSNRNLKPGTESRVFEGTQTSVLFGLYCQNLKPKSRGRVLLRSSNPSEHPRIINGYLTDPADVKVLIEALKMVKKISETKSFKERKGVFKPFTVEACSPYALFSDQYYECLARYYTLSADHWAGSCKMGPKDDPDAVVSNTLEVYGVQGLRVVDASMMPQVTSGNTNIPTIMIAEKAADLIKQAHGS